MGKTELETLNDQVIFQARQGNYDQALVAAQKALQITEQTFGPNHPDTVTNLSNLAELYYAQK